MKIQIKEIIESSLTKEIRYTIEMDPKVFNKMPGDDYTRNDWYFKDSRIRNFKYSNPQKDIWQIITGTPGLVKKETKVIPAPNKEDKKRSDSAKLFLSIEGKRPIVKNTELYLERITAILPNNKKIKFYSTEAESTEDIKNIELLKTIDSVSVKQSKFPSLSTLALDLLKRG